MSMPLSPARFPGVKRWFPSNAYAGSGATPRTRTITLPEYGVYLCEIIAWHGNPNSAAQITALVSWFKNDATVGAQQNTLAKSNVLGTVARSTGGTTATQITDITVGDPNSSGAFVVSVPFTGADINPRIIVRAFKLADAAEFNL